MAETYTAAALGVAFANSKSMFGIFNGAESGKIIRVYRIWVLNSGTGSLTGVLTTLQIRRSTAQAAGTGAYVTKHDSNNAAIAAQVTIVHNGTVTDDGTLILRQWFFSNDEPAVSGATLDEWEVLVPLCCVWDAGYGDSNVQPITLREGEGVHVKHSGTSAVGFVDVFAEFTQAAA